MIEWNVVANKIRNEFERHPVVLYQYKPISVEYNGVTEKFLCRQASASVRDGYKAALQLTRINREALLDSLPEQWFMYSYKLSGKDVFEGVSIQGITDEEARRFLSNFQ